ncbi:glycine oxidase ThiO [Corynebacterium uropygiale]|uniref:glycine oxidase n=1 Tax=Corynebacterium uropygiale TaxID=1775911 RepID=A0A9X1TYG4_9CORY|nr:glycine oxidase ThiO [Corynebacterium uropygiale]MCF4007265.1 glycine oxidase ThiO [Corynebacterium uropygiale]
MGQPEQVIIVGGGIIGLGTALELRRRGLRVRVYDPEPASGASRAAAGMLAPVAEVVWDQPGLYPLMVESGRIYPEFVEAIAGESGATDPAEVGYLPMETLVCAGDAADRRTLAELMELQHELDMEVSLLSAREARRREPELGPGVVGAVHIPGDHQVNPRRLTAAMLRALGEDVHRARVRGLHWEEGRVAGVFLKGEEAPVRADHVLLAAGLGCAGIEGLPSELSLPVRPVFGEVLRLRAPEGRVPLARHVIRGIVRGRPVYVVPRSDEEVVLGATTREDEREGVVVEGVYQLLRDASRLVPAVLDCELTEAIARARPGSPDDVPMIGRVAEGLSVSTGYFRHGILLAALGARLGANAVCGTPMPENTARAVDPWRFSEHGAYADHTQQNTQL